MHTHAHACTHEAFELGHARQAEYWCHHHCSPTLLNEHPHIISKYSCPWQATNIFATACRRWKQSRTAMLLTPREHSTEVSWTVKSTNPDATLKLQGNIIECIPCMSKTSQTLASVVAALGACSKSSESGRHSLHRWVQKKTQRVLLIVQQVKKDGNWINWLSLHSTRYTKICSTFVIS